MDLLDEQLENAKILINEGLIEEGKKTLRDLLLRSPDNLIVRKLLDEIHDQELEQLLHASPQRPARGHAPRPIASIDVDAVIDQLDRDLGLGLGESASHLTPLFDLEGLQQAQSALPPEGQMDLGIALMELDELEAAARIFSDLQKAFLRADEPTLDGIAAVCLQGTALSRMKRFHEAIECLEPVARDPGIEASWKLELYYLLGRAYERIGKESQALSWYAKCQELDPDYRDLKKRVHGGIRSS